MNDKYQQALDKIIEIIGNNEFLTNDEVRELEIVETIQQLIDYTRPLTINEIKVDGIYIVGLANGHGIPSIEQIKSIKYQHMADWVSFYGLDNGYRFDDFIFHRIHGYMKEDKE